MKEEKIENLLQQLARTKTEPVRSGLAEDIKRQIPHRLVRHRGGMDTINIVIDLRVNKLAAAAAIIITIILCVNFLGDRNIADSGLYADGKLLMQYLIGSKALAKGDVAAVRKRYDYLISQGKEAAFYGYRINIEDSNAVLMHWKLSNGNYRVIFGDLSEREIGAEQLIKLQAQMLQNKAR